MSIFGNINDFAKLNDEVLDEYYSLMWDWINGKRIKWKVVLKKDAITDNLPHLNEITYYYPKWVFETSLVKVLSDVRYKASEISGKKIIKINLSRLDIDNMRIRFNNIIEKCEKFIYKGDIFIAMRCLDTNIDYVRNEILTMMYNYISKETFNANKYFKNIGETNSKSRVFGQHPYIKNKFTESSKYDTATHADCNSWNVE